MSYLSLFEINFDNGGVFMPGSFASGHVKLQTEKIVHFRHFDIMFTGDAKINWIEKTGKKHLRVVDDSEVYFSKEIEAEYGVLPQYKTLNANEIYTIPFEIQLPANIPPTYSHSYGQISYRAMATLDPGRRNPVKQTTKMFIVQPQLDLNQIAAENVTFWENKIQPMKIWCFKTGWIDVSIKLSNKLFAEGQRMRLRYNISNNSRLHRLTNLELELGQLVLFHRQADDNPFKMKSEERLISRSSSKLNLPYGKDSGSNIAFLKIPEKLDAQSPPSLANSSIIEISYFVRVTIDDDMCFICKDKPVYTTTIPIILGNVPLHDMTRRSSGSYEDVVRDHSLTENTYDPTVRFVDLQSSRSSRNASVLHETC